MPLRPPHSARPRGFSLIELLVVIGIITVVIALFLPALGAAREVANGTVCLAQIRGLGVAGQIYGNDWQNIIPWTYTHNSNWLGQNPPPVGWETDAQMDANNHPRLVGNISSNGAHFANQILPYVVNQNAFICKNWMQFYNLKAPQDLVVFPGAVFDSGSGPQPYGLGIACTYAPQALGLCQPGSAWVGAAGVADACGSDTVWAYDDIPVDSHFPKWDNVAHPSDFHYLGHAKYDGVWYDAIGNTQPANKKTFGDVQAWPGVHNLHAGPTVYSAYSADAFGAKAQPKRMGSDGFIMFDGSARLATWKQVITQTSDGVSPSPYDGLIHPPAWYGLPANFYYLDYDGTDDSPARTKDMMLAQ